MSDEVVVDRWPGGEVIAHKNLRITEVVLDDGTRIFWPNLADMARLLKDEDEEDDDA